MAALFGFFWPGGLPGLCYAGRARCVSLHSILGKTLHSLAWRLAGQRDFPASQPSFCPAGSRLPNSPLFAPVSFTTSFTMSPPVPLLVLVLVLVQNALCFPFCCPFCLFTSRIMLHWDGFGMAARPDALLSTARHYTARHASHPHSSTRLFSNPPFTIHSRSIPAES